MQPRTQLYHLILIALSLSGWLMWLGERNRANPTEQGDAFRALEQQNQDLRAEISQLQQALEKAEQGSSGSIAIPNAIVESLERYWPSHPAFPDLHIAGDAAIFTSQLEELQSQIPESYFTQLLFRCGFIESRTSFLKQLALSRSEGSRAIAGTDHLILASDFDSESIPDQAELLGAIQLYWLRKQNPNRFTGNRALEFDLTLRACSLIDKTDYLLRFARQGDAMLPGKRSDITPIEELPLAVRSCIRWQAQRQLDIDAEVSQKLKNGDAASLMDSRQGLGPIFTPHLLNPTSEKPFPGKISDETVTQKSTSRPEWTLTFETAQEAENATHALELYFSDWPPAFGTAPVISHKNQQVILSF